MRAFRAALLGLVMGLWVTGTCVAQETDRMNLYRFILGVDVPSSPAFVPLGLSPTHVLRGSAPKPLEASVMGSPMGEAAPSGLAVGVAPYFLVGGGRRTLAAYRTSTVAGRLLRVLTKTVVSFGAARVDDDTFVGMAVRSTFHDPHDPVLKSSLAEDVAAALRAQGVPPQAASEEDVTGYGVDLAPHYARARRAMQGRVAGGDPQVSGGWGMAARLRSAAWDRDSLGTLRHTFWLSAQVTLDPRFDVLGTVRLRDAFGSDSYGLIGAAVLRKTSALDLTAEVVYDTQRRALYPGLSLGSRVLPTLGLTAALTTRSAPDFVPDRPRQLAVRVVAQWFYASDR